MNELAVVTYRLVKDHQACGLKGLVFALDTGGHIDVMRFLHMLNITDIILFFNSFAIFT
jgi:hypothetical protein